MKVRASDITRYINDGEREKYMTQAEQWLLERYVASMNDHDIIKYDADKKIYVWAKERA